MMVMMMMMAGAVSVRLAVYVCVCVCVSRYGTLEQRVGGESQLPFGYCCLTLKPVEDPVVTCV